MASLVILPAAQADELTGTLKKIQETRTIALGVRDSAVPFSYLDGNQNYVGFTVDICRSVAETVRKHLNLPQIRITTNTVVPATRIPLIANGTIDLECSTTTNNADRQKQVSFTNTHFLSATRFVSRKDQKLDDVASLQGKSVAAVSGSTNLLMVNKANQERGLGLAVQPVRDVLEGFLLVESGRVAAFATDDVQLSVMVAQSKDPSAYVISKEALSAPEPFGVVLRKDDTTFKRIVDQATADIYRSGEIMNLYRKWLQSPVPPRGVNFNIEPSQALLEAYKSPSDSADPQAYVR
ncbi:ABC transporter [Methylobacterium sp. Leaf361]|uniref:amino acid ABC transporter substrate-binding protein n=1 Tax=Methylobacterium sp. Leaf361 TaxID=1736352 RepID=UPI0006F42C7D|nr:amino acid ABC transporter substrate-binding protein [Methylobacterium sp. Leaf361]KQS63537.1 ABC transporter [Methylobacterium sp. Leaf361]